MGVKSYCAGAVTDAAKGAAASAAGAVKSRIRIPGRGKYTEERVPENYMAEYYMEEYSQSLHPEDLAPEPLPASKTSQPGPTSSVAKTAAPLGASKYLDTLGFGAYPDVYDSPGLQEGGPPGTTRWARKRSGYLNNQPSTPGTNLGDAMPLSPMVEHEMATPVNTGLVILLTLLFITLVILKK
jgi:hypothetical protein